MPKVNTRKIDVTKIQPLSEGCGGRCPININEHEAGNEICCDISRQCCFFCEDEDCPIFEKYKDIINAYHGWKRLNDLTTKT
jgi:hypothetical protein